ncbi:unnamed protein product [Trichogramma brassicae]|uniref:Uncharacterized protein n=1 Tax=Trichogramma brassicae TaxID=86971 RepID=A0A6H5IGJ9_9HYME|nr:unnamed protein product [Trichogramma brassicae]
MFFGLEHVAVDHSERGGSTLRCNQQQQLAGTRRAASRASYMPEVRATTVSSQCALRQFSARALYADARRYCIRISSPIGPEGSRERVFCAPHLSELEDPIRIDFHTRGTRFSSSCSSSSMYNTYKSTSSTRTRCRQQCPSRVNSFNLILGYDVIDDDVNHGPRGEGERVRQHGRSQRDAGGPEHAGQRLDHPGQLAVPEALERAEAGGLQRQRHRQALGEVLDADAHG